MKIIFLKRKACFKKTGYVHAHLCPTLYDPMDCSPQAPLSMEFPRQEYWSGLPFLSPGDLTKPGIEPASLASPALANGFFTTVPPGKPSHHLISYNPEYLVRVSYLLKHILESVSLRKILITLLYCFYITQSVFRSIANTLINLFESYLIPKYGPFF